MEENLLYQTQSIDKFNKTYSEAIVQAVLSGGLESISQTSTKNDQEQRVFRDANDEPP